MFDLAKILRWMPFLTHERGQVVNQGVRIAMKKMKSGKEVVPEDIPVEVWNCLGLRFVWHDLGESENT